MGKVRCKDCAWRLNNSNFCLKRKHVISIKKPIYCNDFEPKKDNKIKITIEEKEIKVIKEKPVIIEKPIEITSGVIKTFEMEKQSFWQKLKNLFKKLKKWLRREKIYL